MYKQLLGASIGLSIASLVLQFAAFASINHLETRLAIPPRDYQIAFKPDSTFVYSGGNLLRAFKYNQNSIDSVIWKENE